MCNGTTIEQNASIGSHVEQIGIQNNYNGILPEQATQMAISLFMDNFPKLQEEAKRIARERAEELCKGIIESLSKKDCWTFQSLKIPIFSMFYMRAKKNMQDLERRNFMIC